MKRRIHKLFLPLVFPAGIAPGEGSDYNLLRVARNGAGAPVLRGTALAGALRHGWARQLRRQGLAAEKIEAEVREFFGYALGQDADASGVDSRLHVNDCVLDAGQGPLITRTHHLRNRHTGVVADGGLFSLEACPPGTRTALTLWLRDDADSPEPALEFLRTLAGLLQSGLTLGGNSARGVGFVRLQPPIVYRAFDLTQPDDCAAWLDQHRAWREAPGDVPDGQPFQPAEITASVLEVEFELGIPRGQDVLVGDGQGLDHEIEPQRVTGADGKLYWRLPGASLRGLFRGWVSRLAARERRPVADHAQRQQRVWRGELGSRADTLTGDNLGWCFLPMEHRRHQVASTDCPVAALFGSLFQAGRIFISDAFAPCSSGAGGEEQQRMHVAVDRITGGAAESMLFDNTVLTAYPDGSSPRFAVTLRVEDVAEHEAGWLAKTLRALDLGLLRVGSSKSSGRLVLQQPPRATGPSAELFHALQPASRK